MTQGLKGGRFADRPADKFEPSHSLLQSLVGINQNHRRIITGKPSTHLSGCLTCVNAQGGWVRAR
jgi:hypothetical protein